MANFVPRNSRNQILIQIGLVLLIRPDTCDDMSQPWKGKWGRIANVKCFPWKQQVGNQASESHKCQKRPLSYLWVLCWRVACPRSWARTSVSVLGMRPLPRSQGQGLDEYHGLDEDRGLASLGERTANLSAEFRDIRQTNIVNSVCVRK